MSKCYYTKSYNVFWCHGYQVFNIAMLDTNMNRKISNFPNNLLAKQSVMELPVRVNAIVINSVEKLVHAVYAIEGCLKYYTLLCGFLFATFSYGS